MAERAERPKDPTWPEVFVNLLGLFLLVGFLLGLLWLGRAALSSDGPASVSYAQAQKGLVLFGALLAIYLVGNAWVKKGASLSLPWRYAVLASVVLCAVALVRATQWAAGYGRPPTDILQALLFGQAAGLAAWLLRRPPENDGGPRAQAKSLWETLGVHGAQLLVILIFVDMQQSDSWHALMPLTLHMGAPLVVFWVTVYDLLCKPENRSGFHALRVALLALSVGAVAAGLASVVQGASNMWVSRLSWVYVSLILCLGFLERRRSSKSGAEGFADVFEGAEGET